MRDFREIIEELKEQTGLTLQKLAKQMNISNSAMTHWIYEGYIPSVKNQQKMLNFLDSLNLDKTEMQEYFKAQYNNPERDKSQQTDFALNMRLYFNSPDECKYKKLIKGLLKRYDENVVKAVKLYYTTNMTQKQCVNKCRCSQYEINNLMHELKLLFTLAKFESLSFDGEIKVCDKCNETCKDFVAKKLKLSTLSKECFCEKCFIELCKTSLTKINIMELLNYEHSKQKYFCVSDCNRDILVINAKWLISKLQ